MLRYTEIYVLNQNVGWLRGPAASVICTLISRSFRPSPSGLENRRAGNRTVGSNPTLSAITLFSNLGAFSSKRLSGSMAGAYSLEEG